MPKPWWGKYEGLLDEEIRKLEEAGFCCQVDEKLEQQGLLSLHLVGTVEGKEIHLDARYPEHYPYFHPEVFTEDFRLTHHQNLRAGNLCLTERSSEVWHTSHSLAGLLERNLINTIKAGNAKTVEETGIEEVPQPEPISEYMTFSVPGSILFDGSWEIPTHLEGGFLHISLITTEKSFVASIDSIEDDKGNCIFGADEALNETLKDAKKIRGRWVRVPDILQLTDDLKDMDPKKIMAKLQATDPGLGALRDNQYDITGILFREETEQRKEGDGWIFILRFSSPEQVRRGKKIITGLRTTPYLVRGSRAGRDDLSARVPFRDILKSKTVTLIGLGCMGAPIAFELARAGIGEMRIMDPDMMEAGNAVRWPLGFSYAGTHKVEAVNDFIRQNMPYTKVVFKNGKVGGVVFPGLEDLETCGQMLDSILQGTDLIIDATGEDGVNHFLSEMSGELNIPIIFAATTVGTWGGDIVRLIPGKTEGCWACYGYLQKEGKLPKPPKDPSPEAAEIAPRGCTAPTFTGNQFDATIISMACVRAAVGTLLRESNSYPLNDDDVTIIRLRDNGGMAIMPVFESHPLRRHELCKSIRHR